MTAGPSLSRLLRLCPCQGLKVSKCGLCLPSPGPAPAPNCPCGEMFFLISNWIFPHVLLPLILFLGTSRDSPGPASLQTHSC